MGRTSSRSAGSGSWQKGGRFALWLAVTLGGAGAFVLAIRATPALSRANPWGFPTDRPGIVAGPGAPRLSSGMNLSGAGDVIADIELGQLDFAHNMANFGGPIALHKPYGVAIDRLLSPNGVYVADSNNHRVLGWHDVATLTNGGPADVVIGQPDFYSGICNNGTAAGDVNGLGPDSLCQPYGVAVDSSGNLYVADGGNSRVLAYASPLQAFKRSGQTTGFTAILVFGQGSAGTNFTASACATSATALCSPAGVALDAANNLYVADTSNNRVLEYNTPFTTTSVSGSGDVTADLVFGQGSTGTGSEFTTNNAFTPPSATSLWEPRGVAVDSSGNLYVADSANQRVLEYNTPLTTTSVSGSGDVTADLVFGQGSGGNAFSSAMGCQTTSTGLCYPQGLALDGSNNLYVADWNNTRVLEYNTPLAGTSPNVTADLVFGQGGSFTASSAGTSNTGLAYPAGVAVDNSNNVYVADTSNNRLLEYNTPLNAGSGETGAGDVTADIELGQKDFTHSMANFGGAKALRVPRGVAIDRSTTPNGVYVADWKNNRVLGWSNVTSLTNGGPADVVIGQPDFHSAGCNDGTAAGDVSGLGPDSLCQPYGVAVDPSGNLYVSDNYNNRGLEYASPLAAFKASGKSAGFTANLVFGQGSTGTGSEFTTNACANGFSGNPSPSATGLCGPEGVALDAARNLYVSDSQNNRVLEYNTPLANPASPNVTASLVFGQSSSTDFTDRVCTTTATGLCAPWGIALDTTSNLYVVDSQNNRVLEYNTPLANPASPNVTANLVFGQGSAGTNFTASACATSATGLCVPEDIALDSSNNLYVADNFNNRVLEYNTPLANPASPNVTANLVFGQGSAGTNFTSSTCADGFSGAPQPSATGLCRPEGVALDATDNLYVGDQNNNRVLVYFVPLTTGTPTPTATATPTPTATATPMPSGTMSPMPSGTMSPMPSGTMSPMPSGTMSPMPSGTMSPMPFGTPHMRPGPLHGRRGNPQATATPGLPRGRMPGPPGPPMMQPTTPDTPRVQSVGPAAGTTVALKAGRASSTPTALVFPTTGTGATTLRRISLVNSGAQPLNGTVAGFAPDSPFTLMEGSGAFRLEPGESLVLKVRFRPAQPGHFSSTLTITTEGQPGGSLGVEDSVATRLAIGGVAQ